MRTYVPWCTVEVRGLRTTFRSQSLPSSAGCRLSCLYGKCLQHLLSHLAGLCLNKIYLCVLCVVCIHSVCSGASTCTCTHVCRLEVHVNSFPHSILFTEARSHKPSPEFTNTIPGIPHLLLASAGITGGLTCSTQHLHRALMFPLTLNQL